MKTTKELRSRWMYSSITRTEADERSFMVDLINDLTELDEEVITLRKQVDEMSKAGVW